MQSLYLSDGYFCYKNLTLKSRIECGLKTKWFITLSRHKQQEILKLKDDINIDDTFPNEKVLTTCQNLILWFVDFANYLVSDVVPSDLSF